MCICENEEKVKFLENQLSMSNAIMDNLKQIIETQADLLNHEAAKVQMLQERIEDLKGKMELN